MENSSVALLSSTCSPLCKVCKTENGSLAHELITCSYNCSIGIKLLSTLQTYSPSLTTDSLLHLDLADISTDQQLPVTLLVASTLSSIWKERTTHSRVCRYKVRSELEQTINLLRTTRLATVAVSLNSMLEQMFQ